ncbi:hypothetical protein AZE42_08060 [Rhizopogon vesiculosus]|uniref:Uncharacterized protein n=1 Tax=Rhizopogon vesiculosus TaxID=180088 RepID=A0A1J8PJ67_9AGAM|nr:hypothetical protein AZE42_08060 [Rhizopogon vesiculosus]
MAFHSSPVTAGAYCRI